MASRAPSKPKKKSKTGATKKKASTARPPRAPAAKNDPAKKPSARPASARPTKKAAPLVVPRALVNADDDDELMAHGGGGSGFGRCGGRLLSSRLEQNLCHWLGMAGIVHSHSPRHYEVRFDEEGRVAAYAPQIVLRGRGREGKSVVIEAVEDPNAPILRKIVAFRAQYGQEFYVIVVASDEVLDDIPLAAFDESCSTTNVNTLIARLAE
ncbi:MAG: hypothetical protein KDE27_24880 [Planctomycetes bacterium]|nr:hypothetical protein [Planctomycetota bacterium]